MTKNDGNGGSIFTKHIVDKPSDKEQRVPEIIRMGPAVATVPPAGPKAHPTEKFLDWLINDWAKSTISLREICRYAPHAGRDLERAMNLAETLVQRGWFARIETRRRDNRVWQILRGTICDTVAIAMKD